MKIKVQAQHLKAGDIVGSGEKVLATTTNAVKLSSKKIWVKLSKPETYGERVAEWGKYTMINVEREE